MRSNEIYLILLIVFLIAGFFIFHYIFNIYEVTFKISPDKLYADNTSTIFIEAVPVNSFGWKTPFRKSHVEFVIIEGNDLIDVLSLDNDGGIIKLKAKDKPGKVSISVKSIYSLLPSTIEIIIEPNIV
ncbi:MAG: hypothetical protein P4L35_16655 [Ignavibacteriaceae bacterium]|nr:hypothetical protein [Ignavibacteriaceae bacterium]